MRLIFQLLSGLILASWIILSTVQAVFKRIKERGFVRVGQAYWGMVLAHFGVAASVIGIAMSTTYGVQDDVQMAPGEKCGYSRLCCGIYKARSF